MSLSRLFTQSLAALLISLGLSSAASAQSIAVVDLRKAMEATAHWKKAWSALEKDRDKRQKLLQPKQEALAKKAKQLEAQRAVSSAASIAPQLSALMQERKALEDGFRKEQRDLSLREKHITDQMLQRMELVIRELATQKNYDFVFEMTQSTGPNVLYSKSGTDITKQVSALYKKRFGKTPLK